MNEDDFLESLRGEGRALRYEADDVAIGRIEARVRDRVAERETIAGMIAAWLRPLAGAMIAATALSVATLVWLAREPADALLALADLSVAEDYYRVAR
jgi:ubiquinone biosynthesis protein COQ9